MNEELRQEIHRRLREIFKGDLLRLEVENTSENDKWAFVAAYDRDGTLLTKMHVEL